MKRLSQHLLYLLRTYGSVSLPGFGIFKVDYAGAYLDRENSSFIPPQRILSFNLADVNADDYLLRSYMEKDGISSVAASRLLDEDLTNLTRSLQTVGKAKLAGIGTFTANGNLLSFIPDYIYNLPLPALPVRFIGRQSQAAPVARPVVESAAVMPVVETAAAMPVVESAAQQKEPEVKKPEVSSVEEKPEEQHEEVKVVRKIPKDYHYHKPSCFYVPIPKSLAKIAACLLLVAAVALSTLIPVNKPSSNTSTASISPINTENKVSTGKSKKQGKGSKASSNSKEKKETTRETAAVETSEHEVVEQEKEIILEETPDTTPQPIKTEAASRTYKYYAVVAAFKSQKQVDAFIQAHPKDRNSFNLIRNKNFILITVASSDDKEELKINMPLIRTNYRDAWIFSMK